MQVFIDKCQRLLETQTVVPYNQEYATQQPTAVEDRILDLLHWTQWWVFKRYLINIMNPHCGYSESDIMNVCILIICNMCSIVNQMIMIFTLNFAVDACTLLMSSLHTVAWWSTIQSGWN
jgi:hypothetical protein